MNSGCAGFFLGTLLLEFPNGFWTNFQMDFLSSDFFSMSKYWYFWARTLPQRLSKICRLNKLPQAPLTLSNVFFLLKLLLHVFCWGVLQALWCNSDTHTYGHKLSAITLMAFKHTHMGTRLSVLEKQQSDEMSSNVSRMFSRFSLWWMVTTDMPYS